VGYSLLALGLLAPVLYPWYLLWGCACLAPTAAGVRRIVVLALCAVGCVLVPPGFSPLTANVLTGVALVVALFAALAAVHPSAVVRRPARRVSDPT
jgi:alpha-1,6-mannosyltransferase